MFFYALTSAGSEVVKPEPERGPSADPGGGSRGGGSGVWGPEGGRGPDPPLENHKLYGFLQVIGNLTPLE